MRTFKISIVSAAILAAASFGAQAQQQEKQQGGGGQSMERSSPGGAEKSGGGAEKSGGGAEKSAQPEGATKGGGGQAQAPAERQDGKRTDRPDGGMSKESAQDKAGDSKGGADKNAADKGDNKAGNRDAADKGDSKAGSRDAADKSDNKAGNRDAADKGESKGGDNAGGKREAHKEIKTEQKTVIKQTIVKENIRPQKIDVQVRVGVAVPRTIVLAPVPPTIIEVYPSYTRYKLVLVDDNTILIIDPSDYTIIDVIEV